jgi:Uncharacterized protein conserved in bacteria (DUF2252)
MASAEQAHPAEAAVARATVSERAASGRAARRQAPRSSHAELQVAADRDPIALLEEQARTRVPELVPVRYGRMLVSPFAFFRGAAAVMANDLAPAPRAGLSAQLSGDAHLANFGGFASPERDLVFDLNDSTRRCRARSSGTSSVSQPASRWRRGSGTSTRPSEPGPYSKSFERTARRCGNSQRWAT